MKLNRTLLCGILWVFCGGMLQAQTPDGLGRPPFGSFFSADIDTINLYSGNLMLDIPVFSLPGRGGLSTGLRLTYNAQGWRDFSTIYSTYGVYRGGWQIVTPFGLAGSEVYPYLVDCIFPPSWPFDTNLTGVWNVAITWVDETGAAHYYEEPSIGVAQADGGCETFSWNSWSPTFLSSLNQADPSRVFLGVGGAVKIFFPDGHFIEPWNNRIETSNGNYAELDSNVLLTDTLGRTISGTWDTDTSGEHYQLYTLDDANGDPQTYRLNYLDCLTVHNPVENTSECLSNVLKSIVLPNGRSYSFTYGHDQGFLTKVTLPSGGYTEYDYFGGSTSHDINDNYVEKRRISADASTEHEWTYSRTPSGSNRIVTMTDPLDQVVEHTFDGTGYETETVWKNSASADPSKLVSMTRGSGGRPSTVITTMDNLEQEQTITWQIGSRMAEMTQSDWYAAGYPPAPKLTKTIYSYNTWYPFLHTQTELQQWNGSSYVTQGKTHFYYDEYSVSSVSGTVPYHHSPSSPRLNLTTIRRYADGSNYVEEHFHYDELGNVVLHTDPRGKTTTFDYTDSYSDLTNRYTYAFPTLVTNDEGHTVSTVYNFETGLPVTVTDPRNQDTTLTYDLMNRPDTITEPNGRQTTYSYTDDPANTLKTIVQVKVETGVYRKTEARVNRLNRPIKVIRYDPAGDVAIDTEYDDVGKVKRVSQPYRAGSPVWTTTDYDVLGRPVEITNPDSSWATISYYGNTVTTTDETQVQRENTYNALGQLIIVKEPYPNLSNPLETDYSYYAFGPLKQVTQGSQTRTFSHDWLGRMTSEEHPETGTTDYTYYNDGLLHTREDARGIVTTYAYDDIGRPLTVTYSDSTPDVTYTYDQNGFTGFLTSVDVDGVTASTLEYDAAGNLSETRTFNIRNHLTRIAAASNSSTVLDIGYGYGTANNGRIRSRTDVVQPEHSAAYTFDEIGRLKGATGGDSSWDISWEYDRYGNRTSQTPSGLADEYEVGTQTTASYADNKRDSPWVYDDAGNLTYDGSDHFYYDAEDRLIQINSSAFQYAYDQAGRRIIRKTGSLITYYFYGLTGLTSEFSTTSGASGAASSDRLQYRVGEQTGTAVILMDSGGTPRENNRVFPFGEPWLAFAASNNSEKFTTYQHDNDDGTDLDYAMARYYASRSGRFMTPDPGHVGANVGDPQSWNAYTYVTNDPINRVDSAGLESCYVDSIERDCGDALRLVGIGAADFCPYNMCSFLLDGQFYKFFAGAGGASGYVNFFDIPYLYEKDGLLLNAGTAKDFTGAAGKMGNVSATDPASVVFQDLRARLNDRLLNHAGCAAGLWAGTGMDAVNRLNQIPIGLGNTYGAIAVYLPPSAQIILNDRINWQRPSLNGNSLILEEMRISGTNGMSNLEFIDKIILHEFFHDRGARHVTQAGSDAMDRYIWNMCFKT